MKHYNLKDLTGKRFKRLLVIEYIKSKERTGTVYLCKCDCGNEKIIGASALKRGQVSCGCYLDEIHKSYAYKWHYNSLKYSAKHRKIKVLFSVDQFLYFIKIKKCHYCFAEIKWYEHVPSYEVIKGKTTRS
jgi:hypothetical protein